MAGYMFSNGGYLADFDFYSTPTVEYPKDAYFLITKEHHTRDEWFRADLTPVLLEDVPKEYQAMLLLLI